MIYMRIIDIYIVFDSSTAAEAYELKKIIKNNELFFREILGKGKKYSFVKDIPNTQYIENLDTFIRKIIEDNFYTEKIDNKIKEPDQNLIVYLGYIIVEGLSKDKVKELYSTDEGIEDTVNTLGESLYQKEIYEDILIKEYFDEFGTKEDFIEYFKNKSNTKELISKIKDKYRFKAYNYVLKNIVDYLENCGYFEPENMLEICNNVHFKMRELTLLKNIFPEELNERLTKLPKLNRVKLDKYFKEFLKEINPDGVLLKIYKDAIRKRKIKLNRKYKGSYCVIKDGNITLEIKEKGTVEDFFTLSHEFMHYVSHMYNNKSIPFALEEFPSIFLEKYAIDFLERKGYSKEELQVLHDFRFNDMREKSFGMLNFLIADIIDKSNGKEVNDKRLRDYISTLNMIIRKRNLEIKENNETQVDEDEDYISEFEMEEYIKTEIDERTKSYFVGLLEYVEAFRYPISSYIAFNAYENSKEDNSVVEKVINYILYATNPTFKDTIELFGLSEEYEKLLENIEKQKQKVLDKNNK